MEDRMKTHGDFGWCELMTDDAEGAVRFYTEVIGWDVEVVDIGMGPYTLLKLGERPIGGIMAKPPEAAGSPNAWTSYITVDDVDARAKAATDAGGMLLMGPMDIPTVGRMALIQHSGGGPIGIITYEQCDE